MSRLQLHPAFYPRTPCPAPAEPSGPGARAPDTRALSTALGYGGATGAAAGPRGAADFAPALQLRWLLDAADERPDALVCLPCCRVRVRVGVLLAYASSRAAGLDSTV